MRYWLTAITALVVFALDRFTKGIVSSSFGVGESRVALPGVFSWTYVQNVHGAFGLFGSSPIALIAMAIVVLLVFWYAFRDLAARSALVRVAFGAIVGGAIGNIVDRMQHGYVVDFIDFHWWPVFNVADSCITIGVGLLILASIQRDRAAARSERSDAR